MREKNRTIAVGVFRDRENAQQAVQELKRQGFEEDQIGVAAKHDEDLPEGAEHHEGSKAGKGAGVGAATGLGVGGLWGLGIVAGALPGIGPAIAGGALAGILSSAAAGAAAGGLIGALAGMGMSEDEAEYYGGEFERGRIIVTVRADRRYGAARDTLQRFGAYDIHSEHDDGRGRAAGGAIGTRREGEERMELREERLHGRPETTRSGEVDVRKEVTTERETVEVPVEREEVVVRREPASGTRASSGSIGDEDEIRVPVKEEHARADKETVSRGEVSVEKRTARDTERVSDDVRKEDVKVETKGDAKVRRRDRDRERNRPVTDR
jgi:uncharacterized protein (TIGR02271 family)